MTAQPTSPFIIPTTDSKHLLLNLSQLTFLDYDKKAGVINVGWITDITESYSGIKNDGTITVASITSAYKDTYTLIALPNIEDYGCIVIRKDLLRSAMVKAGQGILLRSTLIDPTTAAMSGTVGNGDNFISKYNKSDTDARNLITTLATLMA